MPIHQRISAGEKMDAKAAHERPNLLLGV